MKQSIFAKTIKDEILGMISPYEKTVLDAYIVKVDPKKSMGEYTSRITDPVTGKTHIVMAWVGSEKYETVYVYLEKNNKTIEEVATRMKKNVSAGATYAYSPKLEKHKGV